MTFRNLLAVAAALFITGCATTPETYPVVETAKDRIASVASMQGANEAASVEINKARQQIDKAEMLIDDNAKLERIEHRAYLATQYANIAAEKIELMQARNAIEEADDKRQAILLQARERDARNAEAQALVATAAAEAAQTRAQRERHRARQAEHEAAMAKQEAARLAEELAELEAKETERGLVLTLDDVLFEFDKAVLLPGSTRSLDKIATFLNDHPDRKIRIEGFTDAIGSDSYNQRLSERRANAVRTALVERGVEAERISAAGYGEQYPVANNETQAGRQQNRRVEVIIANEGEQIVERSS
ncbi:MAG: OmpA family protein [Gammaproteobacteria bacterium]|nr:OmpA family protein [Gammaproteobacteria bacterium]